MKHHGATQERVLKHRLTSRIFHWGLVLGFLPAALTGFVLWLKPGTEEFVNLAMRIHIIGAAIFTLSVIFYAITSMDRVVSFLQTVFQWNMDDVEWMKVGGGYPQKMFLRKEIPVPPMGKLNSGQKMMGIFMFYGGAFLLVSGWVLYLAIPFAPKNFIYWMDFGHLWIGLFLGMCTFAHIFLGIYNWGEFIAMFGNGTVSMEEAQHHNPNWVRDQIEPVKKEHGAS